MMNERVVKDQIESGTVGRIMLQLEEMFQRERLKERKQSGVPAMPSFPHFANGPTLCLAHL